MCVFVWCMCACVHVCVCVCVCACVRACMCLRTDIHVDVVTHACMHVAQVHSKSAQSFYEPAGTERVLAAPLIVPTGLTVTRRFIFVITCPPRAMQACMRVRSARLTVARSDESSLTVAWEMPPTGAGAACPEGRLLFTEQGSIVTASSDAFAIPCNASHVLRGEYVIQGLVNDRVYTLELQARATVPPPAATDVSGGSTISYTPWVGTAGASVVQGSPIAEPAHLRVAGVTAESVVLTWRGTVRGVRARSYRVRYALVSAPEAASATGGAAAEGEHEVLHVGGPGALQTLNVTGLASGWPE